MQITKENTIGDTWKFISEYNVCDSINQSACWICSWYFQSRFFSPSPHSPSFIGIIKIWMMVFYVCCFGFIVISIRYFPFTVSTLCYIFSVFVVYSIYIIDVVKNLSSFIWKRGKKTPNSCHRMKKYAKKCEFHLIVGI